MENITLRSRTIMVKLWGPLACFTRPEFSAERLSYDVITPSALNGLLKSVFWHPGIEYVMDNMWVRKPVEFISFRCNEVADLLQASAVYKAYTGGKKGQKLSLNTSSSRQQRTTTMLKNVEYYVQFHFNFTPSKGNPDDSVDKFYHMLYRRLEKGQCFRTPCFGLRELEANIELCSLEDIPPCPDELKGEYDLGYMPSVLNFPDKGAPTPEFTHYIMNDGALERAPADAGVPDTVLGSLYNLFESLVANSVLCPPGFSQQKIAYAIDLEPETGKFNGLISLKEEVPVKTRMVLKPVVLDLPTPPIRSGSQIAPRFLWDNATYLLGIPKEGKLDQSEDSFAACKALHHTILDGMDSPIAHAILNFLDNWDISQAASHPLLEEYQKDLQTCFLVFSVGGVYPQDEDDIRKAWLDYYENSSDGPVGQCLVTGKTAKIARVHPIKIRGLRGGDASGNALVSFNFDAATHFGIKQSFNAPTSEYAAFAYASALNWLLNNGAGVGQVGNTNVICWAEGGDTAYQSFACSAFFGYTPPEGLTDEDVSNAVKMLADGKPYEQLHLEPGRKFYVLGLSPSRGRASVKFFHKGCFGDLLKHVAEHIKRMEVQLTDKEKEHASLAYLPIPLILKETLNPKSDKDVPNPGTVTGLFNAVLTGSPYPAGLFYSVMERIHREHFISWRKAAILKAFFLRNKNINCPEEVLTVALNESCTDPAYILGRLFAVYEQLQRRVNPTINKTIRDKYINSAAATPSLIFGVLEGLAARHLSTLRRRGESGRRASIFFDKKITSLVDSLDSIPTSLSMESQSSFFLGYRHQYAMNYVKSGDLPTPDKDENEAAEAADDAGSDS